MSTKNRWISWILLGGLALSMVSVSPGSAVASVRGRKNTALVLGAGTVYSVLKKKPTQSLILGAATYYAYRRYRSAKDRRVARNAYAAGYRAALRNRRSSRVAGYRSTYRSRRHRSQPRYSRRRG